jgi:glycosyltransferase involved in cell wall biosynthesis
MFSEKELPVIWVIVPALNEADNLRVLVPRIVKTLESLGDGGRVLVVDDGSTDDTREAMADAGVGVAGDRRGVLAAQPGQGGWRCSAGSGWRSRAAPRSS